jgi:alpha-beta hydrolase superfamily lysophospholipase
MKKAKNQMVFIVKIITAIAVFLIAAVALAIGFGGPTTVGALDSINAPFKNLDYSYLPSAKRYKARDGAELAYRHYMASPAPNEAFKNRRIVLIHGSSASSVSMHTMAQALSKAGYVVDALDMRGHGDSGVRGQIGYIGQLEDDVVDFMRAVPYTGPNTLLGFSAGGGFVLRFSASEQSTLFDRYLLLSPFLLQAPTNRPNSGGWASVGIPRIIALTILDKLGITRWNDLPVTQFAINAEAKKFLTSSYSYALATNFGAHRDYAQDIAKAPKNLKLIAGAEDELMFADRYAAVFDSARKSIPITIVPGTGHIGITLNAPALAEVVSAAKD